MSAVTRSLTIGVAILAAAGPVGAQTLPADSAAAPIEIRVPVPRARLIGAGIVTTVATMPAGAFLGAWLGAKGCRTSSCDFPVLERAALGAILVPALTVPVAVHLTNRRSGSFLATLGASTAAAAAAALIFNALGADAGNSVLIAPVAAAIASVATEIATTHRAIPETPPNP